MKLFRDPLWNFLAFIIALAGLLLAYNVYTESQQTKKLTVEILTNSSLVSVKDDVSKDITVLYKNTPVKTVSVILLRLQNSGNVPIHEVDFSRPIVISFSPSAVIGEATITETKPKNIDISITKPITYQAQISNSLLNPGDQVLIRILVINNDNTLEINGRIAGIPEITVSSVLTSESQSQSATFLVIFLGLFFGALVLAIIWDTDSAYRYRQARFGFDPAAYIYEQAQKDAIKHENAQARERLARCFRWDKRYIERAKSDFRFDGMRDNLGYRDLISKYEQNNSLET